MANDAGCPGCGASAMTPGYPIDDNPAHSGGSNIGFADGHAKWIKAGNLKITSNGGGIRYYATEW